MTPTEPTPPETPLEAAVRRLTGLIEHPELLQSVVSIGVLLDLELIIAGLAEARRDGERLDWLQAQSEPGFEWAVRRFPVTGGGGMYQLIKFAKGDKTLCQEVRAAIDAAMLASGKGAGKTT